MSDSGMELARLLSGVAVGKKQREQVAGPLLALVRFDVAASIVP